MGRKKKIKPEGEVSKPEVPKRPKGRPRKDRSKEIRPQGNDNYSSIDLTLSSEDTDVLFGDVDSSLRQRPADTSTETIIVELAEDFSPDKKMFSGSSSLFRSDESGEEFDPRPRPGRRGSESSEEYEYGVETEPINIEEMIGGVGSITESAYLLYDSVLNSALRSEVGSNVVIESCDVSEVTVEKDAPPAGPSDPMEIDDLDPANDFPVLQVTKKEGDTCYSAKSRQKKPSESPGSSPVSAIQMSKPKKEAAVSSKEGKTEVQEVSNSGDPGRNKSVIQSDVSGGQPGTKVSPSLGTRLCTVRVKRMSAELSDAHQSYLTSPSYEEQMECNQPGDDVPRPKAHRSKSKSEDSQKSSSKSKVSVGKASKKDSSKKPSVLESMDVDSSSYSIQPQETSVFKVGSQTSTKCDSSGGSEHETPSVTSVTEKLASQSLKDTLPTSSVFKGIVGEIDAKDRLKESAESSEACKAAEKKTEVETPSSSDVGKISRPRRQTRAPKRIADAIKPRVYTKAATKAAAPKPVHKITEPPAKSEPQPPTTVKAVSVTAVSEAEPSRQMIVPEKPQQTPETPQSGQSVNSLKSLPQSSSSCEPANSSTAKTELPTDSPKPQLLDSPKPLQVSKSSVTSKTQQKTDSAETKIASDSPKAQLLDSPETLQVSKSSVSSKTQQKTESAETKLASDLNKMELSKKPKELSRKHKSEIQQKVDSSETKQSLDANKMEPSTDSLQTPLSPVADKTEVKSIAAKPQAEKVPDKLPAVTVATKPQPLISPSKSHSLPDSAESQSSSVMSNKEPPVSASSQPVPVVMEQKTATSSVELRPPPSKSVEPLPPIKAPQFDAKDKPQQSSARPQESVQDEHPQSANIKSPVTKPTSPLRSPTTSISPKRSTPANPIPSPSNSAQDSSKAESTQSIAAVSNKSVSSSKTGTSSPKAAVSSPRATASPKTTPKMTIISLFPDDALLMPTSSPKHSQKSFPKSGVSSGAGPPKSASKSGKQAAALPKTATSSPKAVSAPKRPSSPVRPSSPKPAVKPAASPVRPASPKPSAAESERAPSPKPSRASTPKTTPKTTVQPKSSGKTVKTKGALKYISPEKTTPKVNTSKGAKGIAKATAKLAMAKESTSDGATPPVPEPMDVVQEDPAPKPPVIEPMETNEVRQSTAAGAPGKEEPSKQAKTSKSELKKEPPPSQKPEESTGGTRRRSNRIRVNRWDKGPPVPPSPATAVATASGATPTPNDTVVSSTTSTFGPPSATSVASSQQPTAPTGQLEPLGPPSAFPPPPSFEADKPVKVKSRWRRTSELEMGGGSGAASLATPPNQALTPESNVSSPTANLPPVLSPTPLLQVASPAPDMPNREAQGPESGNSAAAAPTPPRELALPKPPTYVIDHPEITERLKGFEVIRENVYLTTRHRSKEAKRMTCECTLSDEEIARGEPGCGEDCLNRLLMIECSNRCTLGDYCSNKRFQNCEYSKCTVVRTEKKGLGLIASVDIPSGEFLMEYVGEVLDPKEFRRRAKEYSKDKTLHFYFMALKSDSIIDATAKGNISRFINHSCDPNAETQKWTVNGELRIGFFSKRPIAAHEEVTFDYQLQRYGKEAQRCYCESSNCRGWIGEEPEKEDKDEKDRNWEKMKEKKEKKKTREELEEEIGKLRLSGVKNRARTLTLNRLMVRAEDYSSRSQLLAITQSDVDQRCLRLFLDYHGLNLLWSWMVDSSAPTTLKIQILDTFSVLPITNKTILLDSKVYGVVERWANLTNTSQLKAQREDDSSPDSEETSDSTGVVVKSEPKTEDALVTSAEGDPERATLIAKATALLQTWSTLKEEFRIPKKERIEQMKEHEREADRGYVDHEKAVKNETSYDRHWSYEKDRSKRRGRDSPDSIDWKSSKSGRRDERYPHLSKNERRQLFQMKVEEEERQKRLEEERWTNHQEQCYALGVDPAMSYPPQNNGFFHPLDGPEMPPEMFGPGGMVPPQGFPPPPPPSPFPMDGPPPFSPAFPPHFHQMGMGPSPPLGPPPGGMLPPGMPPPPPPQGMGPPPGMVPPGGPMMPFGPPGMPFPPGGMPPPGALPGSYPPMPTPPQPGYPVPPYLPGAPSIGMEPPPQEPLGPQEPPPPTPPSTVLVLKLPKNWKISSDGRRSYYYHTKTRHVQWKFPTMQEVALEEAKCGGKTKHSHPDDSEDSEDEDEESESEEEESSSDEFEEKEEEEEDDDYDDNSLLADARRKALAENAALAADRLSSAAEQRLVDPPAPLTELPSDTNIPDKIADPSEPPLKKKRDGLCTQYIISPRDEEEDYRKGIKKSKIRETKMKLAKAKARAKAKAKAAALGKTKSKKAKTCEADTSEDRPSRKIKDKFRVSMATVIVTLLNPYRKAECKVGRITNTEDFKHLARKLTHFVMAKEIKHVSSIEDLQCNDNVKHKARDFIKKYMSKFGAVYSRQPDD